ncbi:MAG TPA: TolC family protein, partial [Flavobacteriales bacterium]|nr:TolC family protein [Flavobacteriales bacterium]
MRTLITLLLSLAALLATAQEVLTPEDAVRIALQQNHGIRLARLEAEVAATQNTPGQAGMLPTIDAAGSYAADVSSTKQTFFSGEVREVDNADARVLDGAVRLNWTVFDGLAMFAAKDRLQALEQAGELQLRQQVEATVYDVLAAYFQLVQLRRGLAIEREVLGISRERLAIAEAGERIGTASGVAVVQARLDMSTDSASVMDLVLNEATVAAQLNRLLGRDPGTAVVLVPEVPANEVLDRAQLLEQARQANSAVLAARQQQIAADLRVKELRGAMLPQLDVFSNYGYTRATSAVGFLQSNRSLGPDLGARISIPLFDGGRLRTQRNVAALQQEQAAVRAEEVRLTVDESVLNAWNTHTTALQHVTLEEQQL